MHVALAGYNYCNILALLNYLVNEHGDVFFYHAPGPDLDYTAYVNSSKMRNNTVHRYYSGGSRQGRPHKDEPVGRFKQVHTDKVPQRQ